MDCFYRLSEQLSCEVRIGTVSIHSLILLIAKNPLPEYPAGDLRIFHSGFIQRTLPVVFNCFNHNFFLLHLLFQCWIWSEEIHHSEHIAVLIQEALNSHFLTLLCHQFFHLDEFIHPWLSLSHFWALILFS